MPQLMTSRERFHETFRFGKPDRVFLSGPWLFEETRQRWYREGLPRDRHLAEYLGFDRFESLPLNMGPWPPIENRVVEQTAQWKIVEDEFGGRWKAWSDREIGMSQWIRGTVHDRQSWEKLKGRLDPSLPIRYPEHWEDLKRCYRGRDYPLALNIGSFYGWIRNWVGMEQLALWYYDEPELVHEMTEFVADFVLRLVDRALAEIRDFDCAQIWEDMAMKTGPLISPALFREFMTRPMRRVTSIVNQAGIDIITVDSDGNVEQLLPLWLEANVNLVYPLEVAAGCDAPRYRAAHGRKLLLMGNIDKRALRDGCRRADIEREVMAKVPQLVADGGFSPSVDHAVPPDVPFENFRCCLDLVREICTTR